MRRCPAEHWLAVAAITVADYRVGVELASGRARAARRAFVDDVMAVIQVLAYEVFVAEAHAVLLGEVRRQGVASAGRTTC